MSVADPHLLTASPTGRIAERLSSTTSHLAAIDRRGGGGAGGIGGGVGGTLTSTLTINIPTLTTGVLSDITAGDDAFSYDSGFGGLRYNVRHGKASGGAVTVDGPSYKFSRYQEVTGSPGVPLPNPAAERYSALAAYNIGLVNDKAQAVGIWGGASSSSTVAFDGNDATGVCAVARSLGSHNGVAIGMFAFGRRDNTTGMVNGMQIAAGNFGSTTGYPPSGSANAPFAAYDPANFNSSGIWLVTDGYDSSNTIPVAVQTARPSGRPYWQVGYAISTDSILSATGSGGAAFRDDSNSATSLLINGTHADGAVWIGASANPTANATGGISWGTARDAALFRSSAGNISTLGSLRVNDSTGFQSGLFLNNTITNQRIKVSFQDVGTEKWWLGRESTQAFIIQEPGNNLIWRINKGDQAGAGATDREKLRIQYDITGAVAITNPVAAVTIDQTVSGLDMAGPTSLAGIPLHVTGQLGLSGGTWGSSSTNGASMVTFSTVAQAYYAPHAQNEVAYMIGASLDKTVAAATHPFVWGLDSGVHSNITSTEPNRGLINGVFFINQYHSAQPVGGPSAAIVATTRYSSGTSTGAPWNTAPTYPVDFGLHVYGRSGNSTSTSGSTAANSAGVLDVGFRSAVRIGGVGPAWWGTLSVASRFTQGLHLTDWGQYGIRIGARYTGASETNPRALWIETGDTVLSAGDLTIGDKILDGAASTTYYGLKGNVNGTVNFLTYTGPLGPTGTIDVSTAFTQACADIANPSHVHYNKELFIPSGTWRFDAVGVGASGVRIRGAGWSTILQALSSRTTGSLISFADCSHWEVRDVVFDGNWAGISYSFTAASSTSTPITDGHVVDVLSIRNSHDNQAIRVNGFSCFIDRVVFHQGDRDCLVVGGEAMSVRGCQFLGPDASELPAATQLNGAIDATQTTITVDSTAGYPQTGTLRVENEVMVYGSKTSTTFVLTGISGAGRAQSNTTGVAHADNVAVKFFPSGDDMISSSGGLTNSVIVGNIFDNPSHARGRGIWLRGGHDVVISSNTFRYCYRSHILLQDSPSDAMDGVTIIGNTGTYAGYWGTGAFTLGHSVHIWMFGSTRNVASVASDTITIAAPVHNFAENAPIVFGGTDAPGALVLGTTYYVKNTAANTFQVSATPGGSALAIADAGTAATVAASMGIRRVRIRNNIWKTPFQHGLMIESTISSATLADVEVDDTHSCDTTLTGGFGVALANGVGYAVSCLDPVGPVDGLKLNGSFSGFPGSASNQTNVSGTNVTNFSSATGVLPTKLTTAFTSRQVALGQTIDMAAGSAILGFRLAGTYNLSAAPGTNFIQGFRVDAGVFLPAGVDIAVGSPQQFVAAATMRVANSASSRVHTGTDWRAFNDLTSFVARTSGADQITWTTYTSYKSTPTIGVGHIVTTLRAFHAAKPSGAGTIGTLVAYDVDSTFASYGGTLTNPAISLRSPQTTVEMQHAGRVKLGAIGSPAAATVLDLDSAGGTLALLVPRMTNAQMAALAAIKGMVIYDTTNDKFMGFQGAGAGAWAQL